MKNVTLLVIAPAALLVFIGCDLSVIDPGGGAVSPTSVSVRKGVDIAAPEGGEDRPGEEEPVLTGDPGSITGRILFDGTSPDLTPLVLQGAAKADPAVCAKDGNIPNQSLVVGDKGGIANVFVYLSRAPRGADFSPPESQPVLDQKGCIFKPHALMLWAGAEFEMKNSDPVPHNIQTFPARNSGTNDNLPGGQNSTHTFRNAEPQPFASKCAIHPWMQFWTLVVDHPYAAITDEQGNFEISNLPPGEYKFRVFHERGQLLERAAEVVVQPEATTTVEWKYGPESFGL